MSKNDDEQQICEYISELKNPLTRDNALDDLRGKCSLPNFAVILWNSKEAVNELFKEIINTYSMIDPPTISLEQCNRTCGVLAILHCLVSHPEVKNKIAKYKLVHCLYPFVASTSQTVLIEYLRLTSLGVIADLLKNVNEDVIVQILETEIIPILLHLIESGSITSRTLATLILRNILLTDVGLEFVCETSHRLKHVCKTLANRVRLLAYNPSTRLTDVIYCYTRLAENEKGCEMLFIVLPSQLKHGSFEPWIQEYPKIKQSLTRLLRIVFPMGVNEVEMSNFSL